MYLTSAARCSQVLHVSTGTWLSVLVFLVGVLEAHMLLPLTVTLALVLEAHMLLPLALTLALALTLTLTLTLNPGSRAEDERARPANGSLRPRLVPEA